MAPTAVTRPKVGEFTTVSMVVYCGILKTLVACARNSSTRDSFKGNTLVIAISQLIVEGPITLFLRASPYWPEGAATNAPVLNHSAIEGFPSAIGSPGTRLGRRVPLVPRPTSVKLPRRRGVKGSPDAIVQSPLHCQSPNIEPSRRWLYSQRRSCPKGNS